MSYIVPIHNSDDLRVNDFRDLARADRRPDRPGGQGLVIAEGTVVVQRLLSSPYPVRAVLGVDRRVKELAAELVHLDIPVYVATAEVMAEVVGFHLNRGVLAVADKPPAPAPEALIVGAKTVAVLEGVGDHENMGAFFRNAAALDVDAVFLGGRCADPLYRRSVRVSMGHVLRVPFAHVPWPQGIPYLQQHGFQVVALTPSLNSLPLNELSLTSAPRVALLFGSEGTGLSAEALAMADTWARIPMAANVDSLNVATAAAVAFYDIARRR